MVSYLRGEEAVGMSESTEIEVFEAEDADFAPVQSGTLFGTDDPSLVIERATAVANTLAGVIRGQKLSTMIQGREHVRVEGWTLLGSMLGVFPVVVWSREIGEGAGWEARVEARTRDGAIVGAAEAECLRSERTWKSRDSYALRSMAQTRATSKALRGPLGFVMTIAGFEATPEAEMPPLSAQEASGEPPVVRSDGHEPASQARSYGDWVARMLALEVPRAEEWGRSAAEAAGVKASLARLNRVMLWFSDREPASSLGFWSVEELQEGFAVGFDGVVVPTEDEPEVEFAPELPLVEP